MANASSDPTKNGELPARPSSPQYHQERERLPPKLREAYDSLVESYRFHAFVHYRTSFVSYKVLASLVLEDWRLNPTPLPSATERTKAAVREGDS
jgi:hypothetical protein